MVAGLAESDYVEASNASWNWQTGELTPEVVGQIVDIQNTVAALLAAPARSAVQLVTVVVLPSITGAHFRPYYRGPTSEPRVALMFNVDWGEEYARAAGGTGAGRVTATWFLTGMGKGSRAGETISSAGHGSAITAAGTLKPARWAGSHGLIKRKT